MYLRKETMGSEPVAGPSMAVALAVAVAATLVLGVYPRLLFQVAEASARTLGATGILAALR
jgi:NADH:ubiquinone oxidoreductase subunit 4 (subunit M)